MVHILARHDILAWNLDVTELTVKYTQREDSTTQAGRSNKVAIFRNILAEHF